LLHVLLPVGIRFTRLSRHCYGANHRHTEQQSVAATRNEPFGYRRSFEIPQYRLAAFNQCPPPKLQMNATVMDNSAAFISVAFE
jgi:hypothetical protein